MDKKKLSDIIIEKSKEKGITISKLADVVGVGRASLYKSFNNIDNMKFGTIAKICQQLSIDLSDYIIVDSQTKTSISKIDFKQIPYFIEVFESTGRSIDDICLFWNITSKDLKSMIEINQIDTEEIVNICSFYKIPFELFFKEEYKSEYRNIKAIDFIKYRSIVEKGNNLENFQNSLFSTKLFLIEFFNNTFPKKKKQDNIRNMDYIEYSREGNETAYFPVSIIYEETNIPLVFISNYPYYNTPTQHVIDELVKNVYNSAFVQTKLQINDIVWVEIFYSKKDDLNVSIVKFESDNNSLNPEWYTIRGINDKEIEIDTQKLKEFLNLK